LQNQICCVQKTDSGADEIKNMSCLKIKIMMSVIRIVSISFCLTLITSCKKVESDNNNLSPAGKLLVDGKWQQIANTATTNYLGKDTTVDLFAAVAACEKDDFILFHANTTGTLDENTDKCSWDSQIENFVWALLENDSKIALVDSNPDTFSLEITNAEYKIRSTRANSSGVPVTYISTYKNIK